MADTIVNERIKEIIDVVFKGNITSMARASFISRTTLSSIIGGKMVTPGYDVIRRIAEMSSPRISLEWLISGEGQMLLLPGANETKPRIPMSAAAGAVGGFADSIKPYDCEQIPVITAFSSYDYTMIVKGNSMEPKYEGGDEIAIKKVTDYIEWGKVYVLDTRDGAVIKRLYDSQDKYRCVSYNKEYPDFEINKADVFGVYKVVGLIRI